MACRFRELRLTRCEKSDVNKLAEVGGVCLISVDLIGRSDIAQVAEKKPWLITVFVKKDEHFHDI